MKFEEVNQAMDWLENQEPAAIMDVLENYPGKSRDNWECPLANFLLDVTGIKVNVGARWVEGRDGVGIAHPLGDKLLSFRRKFDAGDYPHLEVK